MVRLESSELITLSTLTIIYIRVEVSGKLLVNGHRAPWTKRGARRVGELEWRQRQCAKKMALGLN